MKFYRTGGRSAEFPFEDGQRYLLAGIPRGIWRRFRAKCRRNKVSVRTRLLQLVSADLATQQPEGQEVSCLER